MHEPKRWGGSIVAALGVGLLGAVAVAQGVENEPWYFWAGAAVVFLVGLYIAAAPGTRFWVLTDASPVADLHAQQLREISAVLVSDIASGRRCDYRTNSGAHPQFRQVFHAHFPVEGISADRWDAALDRITTARAVFADHVVASVSAAGITEPDWIPGTAVTAVEATINLRINQGLLANASGPLRFDWKRIQGQPAPAELLDGAPILAEHVPAGEEQGFIDILNDCVNALDRSPIAAEIVTAELAKTAQAEASKPPIDALRHRPSFQRAKKCPLC